jgi:hypothetical protein
VKLSGNDDRNTVLPDVWWKGCDADDDAGELTFSHLPCDLRNLQLMFFFACVFVFFPFALGSKTLLHT